MSRVAMADIADADGQAAVWPKIGVDDRFGTIRRLILLWCTTRFRPPGEMVRFAHRFEG
jgi:hypothetical protein